LKIFVQSINPFEHEVRLPDDLFGNNGQILKVSSIKESSNIKTRQNGSCA